MNGDLRAITDGWPSEPGQMAARRITGDDGRQFLQLRLDLGVLQMELTGRPDGARPHGADSLLRHCQRLERSGALARRRLTRSECEGLEKEAVQYYHRQLAYAAIDDIEGVLRDTGHILEAIRLIARRAPEESAVWPFVHIFPYVRLVHAHALAQRLAAAGRLEETDSVFHAAMNEITEFLEAHDGAGAPAPEHSLRLIEQMRQDIRKQRPADPRQNMEAELRRAIEEEDYERAAELRDRIRNLG